MAHSSPFPEAVSRLDLVRKEIGKVIVGQQDVVDGVLICLLAGGHVLLEGVPGLGKTTLLRTLARVLHLKYSRIQFTPDLMPADIVGSMIMESNDMGGKALKFQPGPVFSNLVLADEINRATPKTQSALLEAMQERTVTSGAVTHHLETPFLVMATQNPIEMEGTYPLPEAQLDRFLMKILVLYPTREDLNTIIERTIAREEPELSQVMDRDTILSIRRACREVLVAPHVQDYAVSLVMSTQPGTEYAHELANKYIRYGSSPRGAQSLVECGRVYAFMHGHAHLSIDDIKTIAPAVLRHRIILNFDAHADDQTPETLLKEIIEAATARATPART
ncbi:AAA family ATPase [uncultured Paludibaculum sp.]|uniref:AAA family ATPase n=1 Tax=uncultured Paludibaculum sp. TaxID=1765020 RepID=UPI002AABB649|nr:AAA family ATPase [uncultured Paludibaculum sp.]